MLANKTPIAIIIQARMGSTRLPGKMKAVFYKQWSLAEVIFEKLKTLPKDYPVILATSIHTADDVLADMAINAGLLVYRGDEKDVLKRFIDAAKYYNVETVVRVCADNPFISIPHIIELINAYKAHPRNYISYQFPNGTPTIKSHIGLFAELVEINTLKKVAELTNDNLYREHVTNYIYAHSSQFDIRFLPVPKDISERNDIRLTIDTHEDFIIAKEIFAQIVNQQNFNTPISEIISHIDKHPEILTSMSNEISRNSK